MNYTKTTLRYGALGVLLAAGAVANAFAPLVVTTSGYFDGTPGLTSIGPLSYTGDTITEPVNSEFTLGSSLAGQNLGTFTLANSAYNFSTPATTFTLVLTYTSPVTSSITYTSTVVGSVVGSIGGKPAAVEVLFNPAELYNLFDLPPAITAGPYSFGVGVQSDVGIGLKSPQTSAQSFINGVGFYSAVPAPAGVLTFAVGLFGRRRRRNA